MANLRMMVQIIPRVIFALPSTISAHRERGQRARRLLKPEWDSPGGPRPCPEINSNHLKELPRPVLHHLHWEKMSPEHSGKCCP